MESALPLFANHFAALNALRERNLNLFAEKCLETKSLLSNLHAKYSSHNQQHAATPELDPELEPQPEPEPVKPPPPKKRRGRPPKKGTAKANPKRKAKKQPSPVVPDPATNASHTSPEHPIPTTNLNETVEKEISPKEQPEIVDEIKDSHQSFSASAPLNADSQDEPLPDTTETITAAEVVEPAPINEPRKIGERALRLPAVFSSNIFSSIPQNFDPANDSSIPSPPVPLKSRKEPTKSATLGKSEPKSKDATHPKADIPPQKGVSDTSSKTSAQSAEKDTKSAQPQSSNSSIINTLGNKVLSSVQPSDSSLPIPSVAPSSSQTTIEKNTIPLAKPTDILQVVQLTDKSNGIPSQPQSSLQNIPPHHSATQPDSSAMQPSQLQSSTLTHFDHNNVPPASTAPSNQSLDPVVQIDSHMIQQEQRLKTMFTSGAEKLKKALSSLRTVPSAPAQVPAPLPAAATIVRHLSTMNQTVSSSHASTGRKPSVEAPPEFVESVNSSQDIKVEVKAPSISKTKVEAAPEAIKTLEIRRDSNLDREHTKYQKKKTQSPPSQRLFNSKTSFRQSEPLNEIEVQEKKVHKAKTDVFTRHSTALQESAPKETDCQPSSTVSGSTTAVPSGSQVQDDYLSLPPEQRRTSYEKAKKIFEASIQPPPPPSNSTSTMPRSLPPTATSTSTPPKPKISSELTLQKPLLRSHIPTSISSPFKSTASPRLRKMDSPLKIGANLKAKNSKIVKVSKGSPMVSKFMEKNIESVRSSEVLDVRQSNSVENRSMKDQTVVTHHQELESLNANDKPEVEESADLNDEMDDVMKVGELEVNEEFIGDVGMIENDEEIQDERPPMRSDSGKQLEEEQEPEMQTKLCKPSSLLSGVTKLKPPNLSASSVSFVTQIQNQLKKPEPPKPKVGVKSLAAAEKAKKDQESREAQRKARLLNTEKRLQLAAQRKQEEEQKRIEALKKREEERSKKLAAGRGVVGGENYAGGVKKRKDFEGGKKMDEGRVAKIAKQDDSARSSSDKDSTTTTTTTTTSTTGLTAAKRVPIPQSKIPKQPIKESIAPVTQSQPKFSFHPQRTSSVLKSNVEVKQSTVSATTILNGTSTGVVKEQGLNGKSGFSSLVSPTLDGNFSLPEIPSDDDSEDERSRSNPTSKIPSWAQSPYLRSALLDQGGTNPDDIFGNVQPLMLEDIFPNKEKRFRVRSSSANWSGVDALTRDEQNRYREYLGYKTQDNGGKGE